MLGVLKVGHSRHHWFHRNSPQYHYLRQNAIRLCSLHFAQRYPLCKWYLALFFSSFWVVVKAFCFFQRPNLLQHLFNVYGRSPKVVKQVGLYFCNVLRFLNTDYSLRFKIHVVLGFVLVIFFIFDHQYKKNIDSWCSTDAIRYLASLQKYSFTVLVMFFLKCYSVCSVFPLLKWKWGLPRIEKKMFFWNVIFFIQIVGQSFTL